MWERLKKMFRSSQAADDLNVLKEKLGRRVERPIHEMENVAELLYADDFRLGANGIPAKQMVQYWQDRAEPSLVALVAAPDLHITQTMNTSETLLQPGSAETFALLRMHPSDEISARNERFITGTRLPVQFMRIPPKLKRSA